MTSETCPQCGAAEYEVCNAHPDALFCHRGDCISWATEPRKPPNPMKALLDEAAETLEARGKPYGGAEDNFERIARLWTAHLANRYNAHAILKLDPKDVAIMMILLKTARLANDLDHRDSWVDIAGYAACGGTLVQTPADTAWDEAKKKREAVDTL